MKWIMFVDDDESVLAGLRGMLRRRRKEWKMIFAINAQAAIAALARRRFDVVVTDMKMPRVDGAALLEHIKAEQPQAVRIVLSGYCRRDILRSFPSAHEFLLKPCSAKELVAVLERAIHINQVVDNERLRTTVGSIDQLPSPPAALQELLALLNSGEAGTRDIANAVGKDPAVSAKVLQIANSPLFGTSTPVSSVRGAVNLMGSETIRDLVVGLAALDRMSDSRIRIDGFSLRDENDHALRVAHLARTMMGDSEEANDAFLGGLLHDIGKLVLGARMPAELSGVIASARRHHCPQYKAERRQIGFTHADVGAYLLDLWGLPRRIINVVAGHHEPRRVASRQFDAVTAVHVANALTRQSPGGEVPCEDSVDLELLRVQGVADRLTDWWQLANEESAETEDAPMAATGT